MEKAVKGATKIKLAAPKAKYVEAILSAANGGEAGVSEVFRTLQLRLRDSTWTIVFKSLIITHLMIREGHGDVTLRFIAESPRRLAISNFTDVQTQGTNIRRYSDYLLEKARGYRDTKADYVKSGSGRLKTLSVDKGLLRVTETVQEQIWTLLKCDMLGNHDPENELTLTAFRLLTLDLLELFKCMNEGTINVLERYFEMSRPDAERGLNIYKAFGRQTDQVVQYLTVARQYESLTRLNVPALKHAPTSLATSLEEYLNDPDFETNRRQYLAQAQGTRGSSKPASKPKTTPNPFDKMQKSSNPPSTSEKPVAPPPAEAKGPAPDLIDFFDSIEQNQQPMAQPGVGRQPFQNGQPQAQQYQPATFAPQQTGYQPGAAYFQPMPQAQQQPPSYPQQFQQPAQPLSSDFTGAGFGGYSSQLQPQAQSSQYNFQSTLSPIPQNGPASFDQQQQQPYQQPAQPLQPQQTSTNPFRQSMLPSNTPTSSTISASPLARQSTNPFAKTASLPPPQGFSSSSAPAPFPESNSPFTSLAPQPPTQQQELQQSSSFFSPPTQSSPAQPSNLAPQRTGTNPFARGRPPANPTGVQQQQSQQPQSTPAPAPAPFLSATPTGSTNPFRQSQFVGHQPTPGPGGGGGGGGGGTFAGFDLNNVDTMPVFPRPTGSR